MTMTCSTFSRFRQYFHLPAICTQGHRSADMLELPYSRSHHIGDTPLFSRSNLSTPPIPPPPPRMRLMTLLLIVSLPGQERPIRCRNCQRFYLEPQNHDLCCAYHPGEYKRACPRSCPGLTEKCMSHRYAVPDYYTHVADGRTPSSISVLRSIIAYPPQTSHGTGRTAHPKKSHGTG